MSDMFSNDSMESKYSETISGINSNESQVTSNLMSDLSLVSSTNTELSGRNAEGQNIELEKDGNKSNEPVADLEASPDSKPFCSCGRSKGILFCLASAITSGAANYTAFVLLREMDADLDSSILLLTKFVLMFVISAAFLPLNTVVFNKPVFTSILPISEDQSTDNYIKILIRSGAGMVMIFLHYLSVKFLTPVETSTISFCNPLLVVIGARIFLNEKSGIFQSGMALLVVIGVIATNRPALLTGEVYVTSDNLKGIGLATGSALGVAGVIISLRALKDVHSMLLNTIYGIIGVVLCTILAIFTDSFEVPYMSIEAKAYALLLLYSGLAVAAIMFQTLSLQNETANVFAVIGTTEIIFSLLFQMLSHQIPECLQVVGALVIIACVCLVGFQKYVEGLEPSHQRRQNFWFLLM